MDKEQIRQLIQRENLTVDSPNLAGVLVRKFEELCTLDAQLELDGSVGKPEELPKLEAENLQLEQEIQQRNAELAKLENETKAAKSSHQDAFASSAQKKRKLEADIEAQKEEAKQLRATLDQLTNKTVEMERLKRRRNEMQEEANRLQERINSLGEEYQKNAELLQSLNPFVERMEGIEVKMKETMDKLWSGLKKDSFDRMF